MSEFRKSVVTGRWVIISEERARRPMAFRSYTVTSDPVVNCPFCPGHEHLTPKSVLTVPSTTPEHSSWNVRVVSNRYPALRIEASSELQKDGFLEKMDGLGAHEVVIEHPDHLSDVADYSLEHTTQVIRSVCNRMNDLHNDSRFQYVMYFKNFGGPAGATISHAHSQLIALPIVPNQVEVEMVGAKRFHESHGKCYYCDTIALEQAHQNRLLVETQDYVAIAPFASRFPFEMHILPKQHLPFFPTSDDRMKEGLAEILRDVLRRYKLAFQNPPYNMILHTAPKVHELAETYHWHVELRPKLTEIGGFEWGSGLYINSQPPEDAVSRLRNLEATMNIEKGHLLTSVGRNRNAD